jgi:hypothetical protein
VPGGATPRLRCNSCARVQRCLLTCPSAVDHHCAHLMLFVWTIFHRSECSGHDTLQVREAAQEGDAEAAMIQALGPAFGGTFGGAGPAGDDDEDEEDDGKFMKVVAPSSRAVTTTAVPTVSASSVFSKSHASAVG